MKKESEFPRNHRKEGMDWENLPIILLVIGAILLLTAFWNFKKLEEEKLEDLPALTSEPIAIEEPEEVIEVETVVIEEKCEPRFTERDMIAMVVMAESGRERFIGKVAVAAVVLNRSDLWNKSIEEICSQEGQFVYPYMGNVTYSCYEAVDYAMQHRDMFPMNMLYFRNTMYHDFADPYIQIGNHYFSTDGAPEWELETLGEKD